MEAHELMKYLPHFTEVYNSKGNEENPIPKDVKITVYCEGSDMETRGFIVNEFSKDLGFEALIVKKWILHSELEKIVGEKVT